MIIAIITIITIMCVVIITILVTIARSGLERQRLRGPAGAAAGLGVACASLDKCRKIN